MIIYDELFIELVKTIRKVIKKIYMKSELQDNYQIAGIYEKFSQLLIRINNENVKKSILINLLTFFLIRK